MGDKRFKYMRQDFGELPVHLHHLTIHLNFLEHCVEASNVLEMTARVPLEEIELDACDLEILQVQWIESPGETFQGSSPNAGDGSENAPGTGISAVESPVPDLDKHCGVPLPYEYQSSRNRLIVGLPHRVQASERFRVRTFTRCTPSDNILEGIYRDSTPAGAPQQYMSQCQQWGFQRIMPIFDDCRAKCTMTTTLEADARYTHLISNGNIDRRRNPEGRPVLKPGDPSRQVITYENPVPMAPYLFIACAGTWDVLADEVTLNSGRKVRLEYLVPPGSIENARIPMDILKEAILWVQRTQDYEYTGDTYRTICMNKSNFGGMENVGNTTIVTDAALINEHTLDQSLLYAHAVIVHEFEHNQCGSETTMETPFDVWLNEAYTVDVERQFMADIFDRSFVRLNQVETIRNPLLGPLAIEDGGHAGRIVREGFNNPDELIDGVTYVKAAEVIRMLRLIIGDEDFRKGKTLYFTRYRHGNANTDQFFECFEEVSGVSLEQFKRNWLYTIGYPKVHVETAYDAATGLYRIRFRQDVEPGGTIFHLPIELALVDGSGNDLEGTRCVFQLKEASRDLVFENIPDAPAFASLSRDYSFYGTLNHANVTEENLVLQTRLDPNPYNRVDAMRQLTDRRRIQLLHDPSLEVDSSWLDLYGEILDDGRLPSALKAYFLRIDEQPLDRTYSTWYPELVAAREKLMLAVNRRYRGRILEQFDRIDTYSQSPNRSPKEGIEDRMLKQVLLDLAVVDDSQESHQVIVRHYRRATTANDRVGGLAALSRSSSPERRPLLEEAYRSWHGHLSGYANYLRVVAGGTREDVFAMIEEEKRRPTFDINQPTWCRSLLLPMAANNKMLWTDHGIAWLADQVIELAPINATTASRLLNAFQHVHRMRIDLKEKVMVSLERIVDRVPESVCPTIFGQASAYLGRE